MTTPTTDATQPGVPEEVKTETPPEVPPETKPEAKPELSARELALNAIAVERDGQEQQPVETTPPVDEAQLAAQLEPKVLSDGLDKMKVKVKIDGVESEVTVEEMQRQYQKNGAAERRLEEATRLLNEARAASPPVRLENQEATGNTETTPESGDDEEGKAFLAALFDGDESKALAALKKIGLVGRPKEPTLDTNQLAAQLTPAIKQQLVVDSALEKFGVDYADIVGDPYLADLADRYLDAEVKGGKPFPEALQEAGKKTRDWLASKGVKTTEPSPTIDRNTKLERKAGLDQIPALNSKATTVDEPVPTASDVINEMRKARGLTV